MTAADWRGTRVLVTGARGFIGAHLCRRLIGCGAEVHGISTQADPRPVDRLTWWRLDLAELPAVRNVIASIGPDVTFHLAGHVTGAQGLAQVVPTFHTNLAGTIPLLVSAAEHPGHRLVLTGSMQEPDSEDGGDIPCSPYAASKWACSAYARMFHALYQLPVVVARPMMVYGPGQWDVTKLLPYVLVSLLSGQSPGLGSGSRELDWVFVDDVVDGLMSVALTKSVNGVTVDLGTGALTSIRLLVERVLGLIGGDPSVRWGALLDRPLERPRAARIADTIRLTGWVAATPLGEGLSRTVSWYSERVRAGDLAIA